MSRASRRVGLLGLVVAATAAALGAPLVATASASAASEPGPEVNVAGRARVGADVRVDAAGLPAGSLATVVVCGNGGRRGTLDCSVASTVEVGVTDEGTFSIPLRLDAPPMPCPCVVMVSGATQTPVLRPIKLIGHPVDRSAKQRSAVRDGAADIVVTSARLEQASSLGPWFGVPGQVTMLLNLVNNGNRAAVPRLDIGWGASADEATRWVGIPPAPLLEPRQSTTIEVPVSFDPLGNGEQVVAGSVRADGNESTFETGVTVRPWGLFALGLLLVLLVALLLLARVVRRQRSREDRSHDPPAEGVLGVLMGEM